MKNNVRGEEPRNTNPAPAYVPAKTIMPTSLSILPGDPDDEFKIPDDRNYEKMMRDQLDVQTLSAMKKLGYYLSVVGLGIEEAAELIRYTKEELEELLEKHPFIKKYLRVKEIELKKDLLKILSTQAKENKNEKWAEWMLKAKYPEFADGKKKSGEDEGAKMMGVMLQSVRKGNVGNNLVEERKSLVMINGGAGLAGNEDGGSEKVEIQQIKQTVANFLK